MSETEAHSSAANAETVESVIRRQLSQALGGRRGMVEAAVPTILFTLLWLTTRELQTALVVGLSSAVVLLVVRLVQRSTIQFVVNAFFGIGLGWVFVRYAASRGASEEEQALAYFLPGILYNGGYAVILAATILVGWPLIGFMVGGVTGDVTGWHRDPAVVKLCSRLTWLLVLPCVLRAVVQAPIYLAGQSGTVDPNLAVGVLGVLKIGLGWPLQLAALAAMVLLLSRNKTPMRAVPDPAA